MKREPRLALLTLAGLAAGVLVPVAAATSAHARAAAEAAPVAGPTLSVQVNKSAARTNPTQWGHIVEDINHSVEGGLNANLVRNSTMKEGAANPPSSWSLLTSGKGSGSIATDTSTPLNSANGSALKLTIGTNGGPGSIGVANAGFYGVGLHPSTRYTASFFARSSGAFHGALRLSLESTGGTSYASAATRPLTGRWTQYTLTLTTRASTPVGAGNRIALYANGTGTGAVYLDVVRVLPPTYKSTGLLRQDLMAKMAAIKPGFWRVPGGNYLEGNTLATRFNWKNTVGPVQNRPGHQDDAWGYWSTDQAGLKAYLDMAESTGAQPLLAVFAGYTLNHTAVPQAQLAPYVQDALDELQYAMGPTNTRWGARRAADGHPKPYSVRYVEIGNEDWFDSTGSYNSYRFPMFYDAIKARYPSLQLVATASVSSRTPDVIDDHYYNDNPSAFTGMATLYDGMDRNGPKHLVGEYAATNGTAANPTGTLSGAIGEAAFMTGLLRNADIVVGASYAPALADVNDFQWPTNLIGFDAVSSFGSPSYYVQQLFGAHRGDYVVPTTFLGESGVLDQVATRSADGTVYVHVVNPTGNPVTAAVNVTGARTVARAGTATVLTGDPAARNSITAPTTVVPVTRSFAAAPSFGFTFPANSVTLLTLKVTGPVTPYLATGKGTSLRLTTPGLTGRSVSVSGGAGVTAVVTSASGDVAKKSATFIVRAGLGDRNCYSFESRQAPGQYLRQKNNVVLLSAPDGTRTFAADATFCAVTGNTTAGVSFRSQRLPQRFLRQYAGRLYLATNGGRNRYDTRTSWKADTTFRISSGWWRSDVDITLGRHSLQATTPGYTGYSLRHYAFLGQISPVTAASDLTTRQDATFTVVPGLADSSCYSFQSVNFPTHYLRHYGFRLRADESDGSSLFGQDATFCAKVGNSGTGVSFQSDNYPNRYLRHFNGDVWAASDGGSLAADAPASWAADSTWDVIAPWAP